MRPMKARAVECSQSSTNRSAAFSLINSNNVDGRDNVSKTPQRSAATDVEDATSSELGSNLSGSTTDTSLPLHQAITEIHDILDCLLRQVPALQDPAPHDSRTREEYDGAYSVDLSHLKSKFPKASSDVLNHLGIANWKRRQQLMSLRTQVEDEEVATAPALKAGKSAISEDSESDDTSEAEAVASQYSNVESTGLQSRTTGEVSIFSRNVSTMGTAITSISGTPMYKRPSFEPDMERQETHRLNLPRPPKPNSMLEGKKFKCPYCSFELVEVANLKTWR